MEKISEDIYVIKQNGTGALVTFSSSAKGERGRNKAGAVKTISYGPDKGKQAKIMYWGSRNTLPQEREDLIAQNNIIPELLGTKRDFILGLGEPYCYREEIKLEGSESKIMKVAVPMPPEIRAFFDRVNMVKYLRTACKNLIIHSNTFTEFVGKLSGEITSIKAFECRHIRAEEQDDNGVINNYFVSSLWHKPTDKDFQVSIVPAYNPAKRQAKFMYHTGDDLLHDDYYYIPRWWGGRDWIELSNRVPVFHNRNLDNGYLIRWHIEIPKDYFKSERSEVQVQSPEDLKKQKDAEKDARKRFISKLNEFLAAEDGAGRAVITSYEIDKRLGKEFPGIKITPFQVDIKDKALLDLFDKSNDANISSQGLQPALASIQTAGKLGNGSEIRNSLNMHLETKTPVPREILLEVLYIVAKRNGWDPTIKFSFRDAVLKTLDESKKGVEPVQ